MDQWYLDYGEPSWRDTALEWVENKDGKGLNTFTSETKHAVSGCTDRTAQRWQMTNIDMIVYRRA